MSSLAFRNSTAVAIALATLGLSSSAFAQDTTPTSTTTSSSSMPAATSDAAIDQTSNESGNSTAMHTSMFAPTNPNGGEITGVSTIRPNPALMATGATLLVGSYVAGVIVAGTNDKGADNKLNIPVAGPWMDLADRNCGPGACANEGWAKAGLIASGAAQGVGVILTVASLFAPKHVNNVDIAKAEPKKPEFKMTPMQMGFAGYGMGAVGTF